MIPKKPIVFGLVIAMGISDWYVRIIRVYLNLFNVTYNGFHVEFEVDEKRDEMPRASVALNDSKQPVKLSLKGFYDLSFLKLVWLGYRKKIVKYPSTTMKSYAGGCSIPCLLWGNF